MHFTKLVLLLLQIVVNTIYVAADPTVTIASGVVVGTTTTLPSATTTVNQFLGIQFAESPPLRFGPPQPPKPWTAPVRAVKVAPACLQQFSGNCLDVIFLSTIH